MHLKGQSMVKKENQKQVQAFKPTSAWDRLPASEQSLLEKRTAEYMQFIGKCKQKELRFHI